MNSIDHITDVVSALVNDAAGEKPLAAIGVDAVDIAGFRRDTLIAETFLSQCFSASEIDHCAGDIEKLATRFALKEAALKALGTGIRGIGLHDIVIDTAPTGEPRLRLSPAASAIAEARHLGPLRCSATRVAGLALAVVAAGPASNQEDL